MIDNFLRDLVYKEWEVKGKKVVFLDLLLLFCTLFFGVFIRRTLGENSLITTADFVCALSVAVIVRSAGGSFRRSYIAFAVMVFQPVFLLNGAMASGKDSVICSVALACIAALFRLQRKTGSRIYRVLCGVLALAVVFVVLKTGINPAGGVEGSKLSYNCPNIYQIIGMEVLPGEYGVAGVFFTFAVAFIAVYGSLRKSKVNITPVFFLKTLLFFVMLTSFFMPYMEVSCGVFVTGLAVALVFCEMGSFYTALVTICCYFACQTCQLTGATMVPLYVYAFLMLVVITILGVQLYKELETDEQPVSGKPVSVFVFLIGITLLGLLIRYGFRDVETMDYRTCLKPWVDEFKAAGSFTAIAGDFYNYTPPYMYILYGISRLPMEPLYPIKLVSLLFDFLLAYFSGKIVLELTKSREKSALAYGIVFCLPTVAANSGMWAQCDAIYVTCIVASLYFVLKDRSHLSMLWYGMAFALKLQSLFVFPMYVFLWVKKKYRIEQFLHIPFMYMVMCVPSALAGKSIRELLLVYVEQGNTEPWMLSWNWPNIYLLFGPTNFYEKYSTAGVIGTLVVLMLVLYYMVKKGIEADSLMIVKGMLMFALLVPYFLPYMHERYGYLADVLAVILFVVSPSKFYIALGQVLLSYTAYTGYLHGQSTVPQIFYCFVMTVLVILVTLQVLFSRKRYEQQGSATK